MELVTGNYFVFMREGCFLDFCVSCSLVLMSAHLIKQSPLPDFTDWFCEEKMEGCWLEQLPVPALGNVQRHNIMLLPPPRSELLKILGILNDLGWESLQQHLGWLEVHLISFFPHEKYHGWGDLCWCWVLLVGTHTCKVTVAPHSGALASPGQWWCMRCRYTSNSHEAGVWNGSGFGVQDSGYTVAVLMLMPERQLCMEKLEGCVWSVGTRRELGSIGQMDI